MTPSFNRRRINLPFWALITVLVLLILAAVGWVINIVKLFGLAYATDPNYIMAGLRAIGIFLAPLGAVLGWL